MKWASNCYYLLYLLSSHLTPTYTLGPRFGFILSIPVDSRKWHDPITRIHCPKSNTISAYNIKSSGKHDTTWNILRCITFSPLHFMLYRGKSISSGTVCSVLLSFSSIKQSAFVWYCDTRISRSANDYKGNRLSFSYFLIQYCGGLV